MPRTTISVLFSGKDNGLSALFNKLDAGASSLSAKMDTLDVSLQKVDKTLKSIKSNGNVLAGISTANIKAPVAPKVELPPATKSLLSTISGGALGALNSAGNGILSAMQGGTSKMMGMLSSVGSFASSTFSRIGSTVTGAISSAYKNVTGFIAYTDKAILMFGNSIRQIAQGIQSFGIAFSIFVSAPIASILKGIVSEAINFDDALIEVQKTTGGTKDEVKILGDELTQISLMLPNTREELAQYAAGWGALGVGINSAADAARLSGLAEWTAKLVMSAEDLTAADVVEKLGKAIILYYDDIDQFDVVKEKIGSVILALEAANNVGASDILGAFQRMAPIAEQMGMDIVQSLTLATSVASGVASSERAGTELAAALQKIPINLDKASAAMHMNKTELESLINTDANGFFLSMAYSIGQMSSNVDQQIALYEQFGVTGGKAVAALISSWENLEKNINVANDAFSKGTRMQLEFEQSLESTKVQLGILRNNITYAGSAIGDALLPYITKFVLVAVPAIQMLTEWFKKLGENVKVQVVGWMVFLAVAGPVVVFFSSLLFMIGLTISGLSSMFGVVMMIAQGIIGFGGAIFALLHPVNLLVAALIGLAVYSTYLIADLQNAEGVVNTYVSRFFDWGYNLISSFADGIRSAANAAYNAVLSVINAFIGLIQSFSPPKEGPLKNVDKWGKGVIGAFADGIRSGAGDARKAVSYVNESLKSVLEGFSPETVGTFSTLFNAIKSTVSAVGSHIGLDTEVINDRVETSANALADFIKGMQTGIPSSLMQIADFLGGLGDDFQNLVTMQLQYTNGEARLKAIQDALKGINAETETLIGKVVKQTGLTADQQTAMIRRIKLEQAMKADALQAEESALQAEQDKIKNDIDKKQEIISILTGLIDPAQNGQGTVDKVDKPDKPPKPKDEPQPFDFTPFEQGAGALGKVEEKFNKASESAKTFTEKLGAARSMIEGFIAAIRGDDKEQYSKMPDEFWKGWERGADIREKVLVFMDKFNGFLLQIDGYKQIINDGFLAFLMGYESGQKGGKLNWDAITYLSTFSAVMLVFGWAAGWAKEQVDAAYESIFKRQDGESSPFEQAILRITEAYRSFKDGFNNVTKNIDFSGVWRSLGRINRAFDELTVVLGFASTDSGTWYEIGGVFGFIAATASLLVLALDFLIQTIKILAGVGSKKDFEDLYVTLNNGVKPTSELRKEADALYDSLVKIGEGVGKAIKFVTDWTNFLTGKDSKEASAGGGGGSFGGDEGMLQQSSQSGEALGNSFKKGFADVFGPMAIVEGATAIAKYIDDSAANAEENIKVSGGTVGEKLIWGFNDLLNNPLKYIAVMGSVPIQVDAWRAKTGQPLLDASGQAIAADMVTGMDTKLDTDTSYMGTGIDAITKWITDNVKIIGDVGMAFGAQIINGIKDSLAGGANTMWEGLKGALDSLYDKLPFWFKLWIGDSNAEKEQAENKSKQNNNDSNAVEQSVKPSGKSALFTNGPSPYLGSGGTGVDGLIPVNITINIDNGGGSIDKATVDYLVTKVYDRFVRDSRLSRA